MCVASSAPALFSVRVFVVNVSERLYDKFRSMTQSRIGRLRSLVQHETCCPLRRLRLSNRSKGW